MNDFLAKLKGFLMPLALGLIGLAQSPDVAPFLSHLPSWVSPAILLLTALVHGGETYTRPIPGQ